jgi:hypothetical protein
MNTCTRCNGTMVTEWVGYKIDPIQDRCLNCGDITSPLIRKNRSLPQDPGYSPVPEWADLFDGKGVAIEP